MFEKVVSLCSVFSRTFQYPYGINIFEELWSKKVIDEEMFQYPYGINMLEGSSTV